MSCGVTEKIVKGSRPCSAARRARLFARGCPGFARRRWRDVAAFDRCPRRDVRVAARLPFDAGRAFVAFQRPRLFFAEVRFVCGRCDLPEVLRVALNRVRGSDVVFFLGRLDMGR